MHLKKQGEKRRATDTIIKGNLYRGLWYFNSFLLELLSGKSHSFHPVLTCYCQQASESGSNSRDASYQYIGEEHNALLYLVRLAPHS